jgi:predicted nucleic acid-binding Zn ribbon protein
VALSDTVLIDCFSCGRSLVYRGTRFCSARCREWFDAGNPPYEPLDTSKLYGATWRHVAGPSAGYLPRPMRMAGKLTERGRGFYIDCAGCGKEFESRGLRCCSPECERALVARQKNLADMLDVPTEKRKCETCGANIPRWRNGRKVSKTTRFCSDKCSARARQVLRVQNGGFVAPNAKEMPISSALAEEIT